MPTFDEFIVEELAVQQIISYDKIDGGCNGGDLPAAPDYVQITAGGMNGDSDYPETSNTQGRTHKCEWDGSKVGFHEQRLPGGADVGLHLGSVQC